MAGLGGGVQRSHTSQALSGVQGDSVIVPWENRSRKDQHNSVVFCDTRDWSKNHLAINQEQEKKTEKHLTMFMIAPRSEQMYSMRVNQLPK